MATQEDICNEALGRIGQQPIEDINDSGSRNAGYCRQFWSLTRDSMLRTCPWPFATKRVQLDVSVVDDSPAYGYQYAYSLPDGCLHVWNVASTWDALVAGSAPWYAYDLYTPGTVYGWTRDWTAKYEIEAGSSGAQVLLCSEDSVYIRYCDKTCSPNLWDALFVEVFSLRLAAKLSFAILKENQTGQQLTQEAEARMVRARQAAVREGNYKPAESDSWLDAR